MTPMILQGKFESQAFVTSGLATIRVSETGAVLQLDDFSTGSGENLRLMLSPGTLSPSDKGEPGLSSTSLIDLGPLNEGPSQRLEMDIKMWSAIQTPVRSVVVFNYADKVAYGTANLTELQPEAGSGL
ncbi:DM13 domain-containing protein [Arthrobacter sp. ZGTC412]|uniref:DM13 domain-containing protein n=1 Tax=Arthrobacter sp. ZGTC412 TaxID=2058900 RepID=UPI002157D978|nr:DM13 domain-containing protein [Arthrobacter sp. ZGTC412]